MSTFTKQALAAELKERMLQKSIVKITVKELVEACDINRQTFYYHFQDIYDLLAWIYRNEALSAVENFRSIHTWQQGIYIIFEYIEENKDFCMNTYRSLGREHLEAFLDNVISSLLDDVVGELEESKDLDKKNREFIVNFYTSALTGTLLHWLENGLKPECKELADNIICLMDGHFYQAARRFISQ